MTLSSFFHVVILPVLVMVIGLVVEQYIKNRNKLVAYFGQISSHKVQENFVFTHSITVLNTGKKYIDNICITHNLHLKNSNINASVYPKIYYEEDGFFIKIPKLVGGEQVTLDYLYCPPNTVHSIDPRIKSDSGFAKILTQIPTPNYPKWFINLLSILIFVGLFSIIYYCYNIYNFFAGV